MKDTEVPKRYRAARLEITDKCFKHHGSENQAIFAALEQTHFKLKAAIGGYGKHAKYVIEIYVEAQ
jgi:hypothetical protein